MLPRKKDDGEIPSPQTTDDESDIDERGAARAREGKSENEKLVAAFKSRHIRSRLHETRLSKDYTVTMRLPSNNNISKKPAARRRKIRPATIHIPKGRRSSHTSDSDAESNTASVTQILSENSTQHDTNLDTDSEEDDLTRLNNAYPGSTNTIGSIHQQRWFLLLNRQSSGFCLENRKWVRSTKPNGEIGEFDPFVIRGRDVERSVVTGRLTRDIESDE